MCTNIKINNIKSLGIRDIHTYVPLVLLHE